MNSVRVGLIGLGSWGSCHLEALRALPYVEVVAVCDIQEERVQALGERWQIANRYTRAEELYTRDDIDLVDVVTYEHEHLQPVLGALHTGKQVLVEKPVATDLDQAREMQAAAEAASRWLIPGHLLRFDPRYAEIHEAIHSSRLGPPVSMYLKRSRQRSLYDIYQRTHTVHELMVHDIDLAIWYAGSRVSAVRAYGRSVRQGKTPELLWACLEFASGAVAMLQSDWLTPDEAGIAIPDVAEVIGRHGIARFETAPSGLELWNASGRTTQDFYIHARVAGQVVGALRDQLNYVCTSILQNTPPDHTSFADAVHGIEVARAIVESAASGYEVTL